MHLYGGTPSFRGADRPSLKAAVIGADGFIGRHLAAHLYDTHVAIAEYTRQHELVGFDEPHHRPDIVFYLASSVTPALAEQHPAWVTADHLRFAHLLQHLAQSPNPPVVVLTSSGGTVYDPDAAGPCTEDAPTRATCRYGAAKLALEELLLGYAGRLPGVVLRLSNVYGPGQRIGKSQGVLAYWLRAAASGTPIHLIGDPRATRDYVYIDDVVECMGRIAAYCPSLSADEPLVLNVASGTSTSLGQLRATVEAVVGYELEVEHLPPRPVDRWESSLDVRRAARVLGWRPTTSLVDGVGTMWRDLLLTNPALAATAPAAR